MQYKSEARFRNQLVNEMRQEGFKVTIIETGSISRGVPDLFFAGKGKFGWIELKNIQGELPEIINIDYRPGQYQWLMDYMKEGLDVYVGISCELGIYIYKNNLIQKMYTYYDMTQYPHRTKMKDIGSLL